MAKNKLERFAEMDTLPMVFQAEETMQKDGFALKGNWSKGFFGNNHPITIELGCGKGEYTINQARAYPERNFIGVDIKGARMWRGATTARDEGLRNVAFLRTRIEFITHFFGPGEVDEIWLTFSDPQPKDKKGSKRLTAPPFLKRYSQILKPGGLIHLKTDSRFLFAYTRGVIDGAGAKLHYTTHDLYGRDWQDLSDDWKALLAIQTFYEHMWLQEGKKIQYLRFQLPAAWQKS